MDCGCRFQFHQTLSSRPKATVKKCAKYQNKEVRGPTSKVHCGTQRPLTPSAFIACPRLPEGEAFKVSRRLCSHFAALWRISTTLKTYSEFTELAKSRFLDCDSCGMTQGALIRYVADRQALYMQAKQTRSDILYMTTLDTGRCSHSTCSLVVLIALYFTIPMAASRSTDSS